MFSELLCIVGHHLRSLHIRSPFTLYLPPRLEYLKTFSLHACRPYHTSEIHRIVLENDPAFLLAHESTILTRCIVRDPTSPILQCLQLISCLYDISLPLPYALTTTGISFNDGRDILETQQHPRSASLAWCAVW